MRNKILLLILTIILYTTLKLFIPFGGLILYPITLLVTFFHETGHALFALLTGGSVIGIQINGDGSGYARLAGGIQLLVLPGGYIGSALWGNLLLYIALYKEKYSRPIIYFLIAILTFSALFWFNSIGTTILLLVFAAALVWISKQSHTIISNTLLVLGTTSLIYIIMDFNGGPSSDLARFTAMIPILPKFLWATLWLAAVLYLTYLIQVKKKDKEK
ncbi:M50 family peptidase [Marinilabiliaceae bacterium JC017]|nr:M50 family peptidase [Marinilabiliaceae bacterium JC017]